MPCSALHCRVHSHAGCGGASWSTSCWIAAVSRRWHRAPSFSVAACLPLHFTSLSSSCQRALRTDSSSPSWLSLSALSLLTAPQTGPQTRPVISTSIGHFICLFFFLSLSLFLSFLLSFSCSLLFLESPLHCAQRAKCYITPPCFSFSPSEVDYFYLLCRRCTHRVLTGM